MLSLGFITLLLISWRIAEALPNAVFATTGTMVPASPVPEIPSLIMISGCTGTGKSTFGMSLALNQRILKCISTDTVRQVMRTFQNAEEFPSLHRSSYQGEGDAVTCWKESAHVLDKGIEGLVIDSMRRGVSLVLEGVHIVPQNELLEMWRKNGGLALGIVLYIEDAEAHKNLLINRGAKTAGYTTGQQLEKFTRIRTIHDEMVRLGTENNWLKIHTQLTRDPVMQVADILNGGCLL